MLSLVSGRAMPCHAMRYCVFRQGADLASASQEDLLEAKQLGYSDIQISQRMGCTEDEVGRKTIPAQ